MNERLIAQDALSLFEEELSYLSVGVVNLVNLLEIDTVLLSGDLRYEGEVTAKRLEALVNERILRRDRKPLCVLPTHADADIKSLASADIVFDRYLRV